MTSAGSRSVTRLWTSADAARAFRVGVSSVKRWTDEGELEAVRTPGGHRRYTPMALHRFARVRGLVPDLLPALTEIDHTSEIPPPAGVSLFEAMVAGDEEAVRRLVTPRVDTLARRAAFFDRVVGEALREVGTRWQSGSLGIEQEHRASQLVISAVDRLRPPVTRPAPLALLACPPFELHDLPLRLVRLILEWSGWRTELLGASLPWQSARAAVERSRPDLLALSSRTSDPFHFADFGHVADFCLAQGTRVVVGGEWARGGTGLVENYLRFRTLRGFERWLRTW